MIIKLTMLLDVFSHNYSATALGSPHESYPIMFLGGTKVKLPMPTAVMMASST